MDMALKPSKDRKVANSLTPSGGVRIANSFGLPAGLNYSCPSATSVCSKVCYAGKLEKIYKGVKINLTHNWDLVKDADMDHVTNLLNSMIIDFITECERKGSAKLFRIHWDGDFFSDTYIGAWRHVIESHPDVRFWVYTRVIRATVLLKGIDNLALYFSTDKDNFALAKIALKNGARLAMLDETFEAGRERLASIGERGAMCPEQRGQIDLNGACVACGLCIKGKTNILFSITKK